MSYEDHCSKTIIEEWEKDWVAWFVADGITWLKWQVVEEWQGKLPVDSAKLGELYDWVKAREEGTYLGSVSTYEDVLELKNKGERKFKRIITEYYKLPGFSFFCPGVMEFKQHDSKRKTYKLLLCKSSYCSTCAERGVHQEEPTPEKCPANYRGTEVFTLEEFRRFRDDVEKDPYTHIDSEVIEALKPKLYSCASPEALNTVKALLTSCEPLNGLK